MSGANRVRSQLWWWWRVSLLRFVVIMACLLPFTIANNELVHNQAEQYLVIQACKESKKPHPFFISLREKLESEIKFDRVFCISSEAAELNATAYIKDRKLENSSIDIRVVATLLQKSHCENGESCPDKNRGKNYVELLKEQVKVFFIENEPDFEELKINRDDVLSIQLFPDNGNGGNLIGQEFCRVASSMAPANIALLYGPKDANHSTDRIDGFLQAINRTCPKDGHMVRHSLHADWTAKTASKLIAPILFKDNSLNAIIAANDYMALGALVAVTEIREGKKILISGFDNNGFIQPHIEAGRIFATIDQMPYNGVIFTLKTLLSEKSNGLTVENECNSLPSRQCTLQDYTEYQEAAWSEIGENLPRRINTTVSIQLKDPSYAIKRQIMLLYNPSVKPDNHYIDEGQKQRPISVYASLRNFQINNLNAAYMTISANGILVLQWTDKRLSWDPKSYQNTQSIQIDVHDIWHPIVTMSNLYESGSAKKSTTVSSILFANGTIIWDQYLNTADYFCPSIDTSIYRFPFDSHFCGIDITSFITYQFTLEPTSLTQPQNLTFDVDIVNDEWKKGDIKVTMESSLGGLSTNFETLQFRVNLTRNPTFIVLSYVCPGYFLNIISFAQFWIPSSPNLINIDRGGMAITTILSALALRESMSVEVGTSFSLLDFFMLMSLLFHFCAFLITAYESSYKIVKKRERHENVRGLGLADRAGKLILPIIFAIGNLILSFVWRSTPWFLSYISIFHILFNLFMNRKDRTRIKKNLKRISRALSTQYLQGKFNQSNDSLPNNSFLDAIDEMRTENLDSFPGKEKTDIGKIMKRNTASTCSSHYCHDDESCIETN